MNYGLLVQGHSVFASKPVTALYCLRLGPHICGAPATEGQGTARPGEAHPSAPALDAPPFSVPRRVACRQQRSSSQPCSPPTLLIISLPMLPYAKAAPGHPPPPHPHEGPGEPLKHLQHGGAVLNQLYSLVSHKRRNSPRCLEATRDDVLG